jgi:hypothetical protein
MPVDPLQSKRKRADRQRRYYLRNRTALLEKGRASYDPEKRADHYRENHEAVCQTARLYYICRRGDAVREAMEEMARNTENESARHVIQKMIADGRHHEMTLKEIRTLYKTLDLYPPPPLPAPVVDKCDEAVISLRHQY